MSSNASSEAPSFRAKLGILLFLSTLFFISFMARIILGPMMPTVEADLLIDHTQAGSMFLMISLGLSIAALCSGLVNSRIGHRNTIIVSFLLAGLALMVVSRTNTFLQLEIGLIFVGLGGGLYFPSAVVTIYTVISQPNWAKAISIHEFAPNFCLLLTPIIVELCLSFTTWRNALLLLGVVSFAAGAIYGLVGRGARTKGEAPSWAGMARVARLPGLWVLVFLFAVSSGGSSAIYSMMSLFLVNGHHLSRADANTILSVSRISGMFMIFVAGFVTDRIGPRLAGQIQLAVTGILTVLMGILSGWLLVAVIVLQGMFASCFFPIGFAALARICSPQDRNLALALCIPAAIVIGVGLFPAGIGYMGDHYTFSAGIILTGILILFGVFTVSWLRFRDEARSAG